jgi:alkylation response protein AidB-like acyl-CoA dehydrogenase
VLDHSELNESQRGIMEKCRLFANEVLRPQAARYDKGEEVPWEVIRQAADAGIYTTDFFRELALDPTGLSLVLAAEELAAGDAGLALAVTYPLLPLTAIYLAGTGEQQRTLIPSLLGTAGTLMENLDFFRGEDGMLIHADNYCMADLNLFIQAHLQRPPSCLMTMMTFII